MEKGRIKKGGTRKIKKEEREEEKGYRKYEGGKKIKEIQGRAQYRGTTKED